ncbi:MAG: FtsX-like permease family protein [Gemmatimonadaceae bacterium]
MRAALARASLQRHPLRTTLAVLGVAVSAAMLLDMVMLSTGMQVSFRALLVRQGFELRLTPKGTLPFDTEARIAGASAAESVLRTLPGVTDISPVLGSTLHILRGEGAVAVFALGIRPAVQGDYALEAGHDASAADAVVANSAFLERTGYQVGDTISVAAGYDAQLRTYTGRRRVVLAGRARFLYLASAQAAAAVPLKTLQAMLGGADADRVSLLMLRTRPGIDVEALRASIERAIPRTTAIATADAVRSVEERLSYFRQLALILGTISLLVGFLLVTTLVTVSVQERLGELAVMRAIGVSRAHIAQQVMLEGLVISVLGTGLGLGLGLVTADYLNQILRAFPGLPAAIDFFVFEAQAAYRSLALLVATAVLAGGFPAWRAASLPIAATLRTEAVS